MGLYLDRLLAWFGFRDRPVHTTNPPPLAQPRISDKWQGGQMSRDPSTTPTLRRRHARARPPKIERGES